MRWTVLGTNYKSLWRGTGRAYPLRYGVVPMLKHLLFTLIAMLLSVGIAFADCTGQFPAGHICGNPGTSQASPFDNPAPAFGLGSISSVGLSLPSNMFSVAGSPVIVASYGVPAYNSVAYQTDGAGHWFASGRSGVVTSVSNSDGTLTISPTTGAVVASLNVGHANVWNATQLINGAGFGLEGNISASAWSTNGIKYVNISGTLTDTSSSGTVATAVYTNVFGGNTIAASNTVTYDFYYGTYFKNEVAGSNVTLAEEYALGADSAQFNGPVNVSNGILTSNAVSTGAGYYSQAMALNFGGCAPNAPDIGGINETLSQVAGICAAYNDSTSVSPPLHSNMSVFTLYGSNSGSRGLVVLPVAVFANSSSYVGEAINPIGYCIVNGCNATGDETDLDYYGSPTNTQIVGKAIDIGAGSSLPGSGAVAAAMTFGSETSGVTFNELIDIGGCWLYYGCSGANYALPPLASTGEIMGTYPGSASSPLETIANGFDLSSLIISGCVLKINISDAAVCALSGNGDGLFAGTTAPTLAAGLSLAGALSNLVSSGFSDGYAASYANSTDGAIIQGKGSTYDVSLVNNSGAVACGVITSEQAVKCNGVLIVGASQTDYIELEGGPSGSAIASNSGPLGIEPGGTLEADFGYTNSGAWTFAGGVYMTGLASSGASKYVCLSSSNELIAQSGAC